MQYTSPEVYKHISEKTKDPIIERKTCSLSWVQFPIFQSDLDFYKKISPVFDGVRYDIPTPAMCPEERSRRRLLFRNEKSLYIRKCDATWETIISIYSPDSKVVVYDQKFWRSDQWSALEYALEIDPDKTFSEQFKQLWLSTPMPNVYNTNGENSDYCNHVGDMKNCYLVSASRYCEDCMYGSKLWNCKDCYDILECFKSDRCKDCIWCEWCHTVMWSYVSTNCRDSYYLFWCTNCTSCIWCRNLTNQEYYIFNEKYTPEAYIEMKMELLDKGHDFIYTQRESFKHERILSEGNYKNCERSYGDRLTNWKNLIHCYHLIDAENCKYCENGADELSDIMDAFWLWIRSSLNYEIVDVWVDSYKTCFGMIVHSCQHTYYAINCHNSSYVFGCIWLRNKQYCIFNKQYTKEQYEIHLPKLIKKMNKNWERWEFFHPSLSPFAYNETVAQDSFPLNKDISSKIWYAWQDKNYDPNIPNDVEVIQWINLPDISIVKDSIVKKIILCEISWRPFRILKKELEIHRYFSLPLPIYHPDIRHKLRIEKTPKRVLHNRVCDKTNKDIISVYPQTVKHKVYSETAYQQEIFS